LARAARFLKWWQALITERGTFVVATGTLKLSDCTLAAGIP